MALSVKDPETDAMVRKLARRRRTSFTGAIRLAVSNELAKDDRPAKDPETFRAIVAELQAEWAGMPVLDDRTADEILGYDENGLPR